MRKSDRRTVREQGSEAALGVAVSSVGVNLARASQKLPQGKTCSASGRKDRPNILYIIPHDLGTALACYGTPNVRTPRLDQLASEGVRFTNHFCNSTACSPARGCIMTGRYAHSNGLIQLAHQGLSLPSSEQTIVDYLNDGGYETYNFGIQHERARNQNRYKHLPEKEETFYVQDVVPNVVKFLKNHKPSDGPFYANVGFFDVHSPWSQTINWKSKIDVKETRPECIPFQKSYKPEDIEIPPFLPDIDFFREAFCSFYGVVSHMDQQVGLLFDALKETGLDEDTIVIFTTDHGISFPRAKTTLYDPGMATSMIMRWPGRFKAGVEFAPQTQHIDLVPTILDILGLPIHSRVQGRSCAPFLLGKDYQPHDHIFFERNFHVNFDPMRAVRTPHYKLIRNYAHRCRMMFPWEFMEKKEGSIFTADDGGKLIHTIAMGPEERPYEELYDLKKDPNEFHNEVGNPVHASALADLRKQMDQWQVETEDFMRGGFRFCNFPASEDRQPPKVKPVGNPRPKLRPF